MQANCQPSGETRPKGALARGGPQQRLALAALTIEEKQGACVATPEQACNANLTRSKHVLLGSN